MRDTLMGKFLSIVVRQSGNQDVDATAVTVTLLVNGVEVPVHRVFDRFVTSLSENEDLLSVVLNGTRFQEILGIIDSMSMEVRRADESLNEIREQIDRRLDPVRDRLSSIYSYRERIVEFRASLIGVRQ